MTDPWQEDLERWFAEDDARVERSIDRDPLKIPVPQLRLMLRTHNCLFGANILTVADLVEASVQDLLDIRNLGAKCIDEIIVAVEELGLTMKDPAFHAWKHQGETVSFAEDEQFADDEAGRP